MGNFRYKWWWNHMVFAGTCDFVESRYKLSSLARHWFIAISIQTAIKEKGTSNMVNDESLSKLLKNDCVFLFT